MIILQKDFVCLPKSQYILIFLSFKFLGHIPSHCPRKENTGCPHPYEFANHQGLDLHLIVLDPSWLLGHSEN